MYDLILKNIKAHITLGAEEEAYFLSLLRRRVLRKKQYLLRAGDICRYECFVSKGCLRAYYTDNTGKEHIGMFGIEDYWISDMYSLISGNPALYNIDALEDSELLLIERIDFESLLLNVAAFERFFRIKLQKAYVAQQQRTIDSMSKSAEERYDIFLKRYPSLEQRVSQRHIASYLGITPESLSRIRSQIARK